MRLEGRGNFGGLYGSIKCFCFKVMYVIFIKDLFFRFDYRVILGLRRWVRLVFCLFGGKGRLDLDVRVV